MNLPTLIGHQTEILYVPEKQNMMITGSAGSGKSLLALYRVFWLAKIHPEEKIVLLTFNKPVNEDMKKKLKLILNKRNEEYPQNLYIQTYHSFLYEILSHLVKNYSDVIEDSKKYINPQNDRLWLYHDERNKLVSQIIEDMREENPEESSYQRPVQTFVNEIKWMQQMSIKDEEEYYDSERIGRKDTRITRDKRKYFYTVFEKYKELRESGENPRFYDYEDIGSLVREILHKIEDTKEINDVLNYKYIFIDEFQDFTTDMLKTINALCHSEGTVTLLGDINQGIYGKRVSFKSVGINMNKYEKHMLNQNYRNSKQISEFAEILSQSTYFDKNSELYIRAKNGKREGEEPKILKHVSQYRELDSVMEYIKEAPEEEEVLVITPPDKIGLLLYNCKKHHIRLKQVKQINDRYSTETKFFGNYNNIKGLEFDTVLMPLLSKDNFIELLNYENNELDISTEDFDIEDIEDELLEKYLAQLYVGVTRAKDKLILSYTGELHPLLQEEKLIQYIK
ncbi:MULTISPECIES: UvrD-helicase domain-containing protein [Staphylococcus]|uniref:DNA 3'-5' helicase n=1 Tax=Staphylococcus pettenkoferi TaxID=170573 RepID=A0A2N6QHE7_9STAP|nr:MULTISPECIES: UvrD-helicase domain-containing protein [Staphylococcus]MCI2791507.1 UvrD-helicase domain-containing protein [Staphylococcus pettenkoferi]OFK76678.1 hypothetical protein HMPREF2802_10670 [Staphylococcus sp. HMSC071G07]PMC19011.1 DUF2075 domain-containing protein [Staphylococcus pettenkoferi]